MINTIRCDINRIRIIYVTFTSRSCTTWANMCEGSKQSMCNVMGSSRSQLTDVASVCATLPADTSVMLCAHHGKRLVAWPALAWFTGCQHQELLCICYYPTKSCCFLKNWRICSCNSSRRSTDLYKHSPVTCNDLQDWFITTATHPKMCAPNFCLHFQFHFSGIYI